MTNLRLFLAIGLATLAVFMTLVVNLIIVIGIRKDIQEIRAGLKFLAGKIAEIGIRLTALGEEEPRA